MLLTQVMVEGVLSKERNQRMIRKLTDTMVSIEGKIMRSATRVIVAEVRSGERRIEGNALTTADESTHAVGT